MKRSPQSIRTSTALITVFLVGLAILLYWPWFAPGFISYGDWWHNLPSRVVEYYQHFLIWDGGSGLGAPLGAGFANNIIIYWVPWLYGLLLSVFHLSVSVSVRLVWFIPYILTSFWGAYYFGWTVTQRRLGALITTLIYPFSTFVILGIQGGHMTIALAYALAPIMLANLIRTLRDQSYRASLWLALAGAFQAIYDVRISYITILASVIYVLYWLVFERLPKPERRRATVLLLRAVGLGVLISAYWILPLFWVRGSGSLVPAGYDSVSWLQTLSYATLTHALAANHVWWPWSEGTIMPIHPLLLLGLVLALLSLLNWKKQRVTLYVVALFLVGAFFAKGVNPPLSMLYVWLFQHVPGFSFFRDPAKFFTLLMLGLAPAAGLGVIALADRIKPRLRTAVLLVVMALIMMPQVPILFGPRHGTFITKKMPEVYTELSDWLASKQDWGRVLWVPQNQRYVPSSQLHPVVSYTGIEQAEWTSFAAANTPTALLAHPYGPWLLSHAGVAYVGVPVDTEKEIFQYVGPASGWIEAIQKQLAVTPVTDAPKGINIYALQGAKPLLYLADRAVVADSVAIAKGTQLPDLRDSDLLVERSGPGVAVPAAQTFMIGLTPRTTAPDVWDFSLDQDVSGQLVTDPAFIDRPLLIDGQPLTKNVRLAAGTHALSLDLSSRELNAQPAAQRNWKDCAANTPTNSTFAVSADQGIRITPEEGIETCVQWQLGVLRQGLYAVGITGKVMPGVRAELIFDRGSDAPVAYVLPTTDQTYYLQLPIPTNRPITAQLHVTSTSGNAAANAEIESLSVISLLKGIPSHLTVQTAARPADTTLPVLSTTTVSPREFTVNLPARTTPLYLVLNEAYHPMWHLSGVAADVHLKANGGLNAWYIPAGAATTVTVAFGIFWPYWIGIGITLLTMIGVGVTLWRGKKRAA